MKAAFGSERMPMVVFGSGSLLLPSLSRKKGPASAFIHSRAF